MTRADLQKLAIIRIQEARQLFQSNSFSGAYYLAGYAIELGLKACIARQTKRYDFPELPTVRDAYTHDLLKLVRAAGLEVDLLHNIARDPQFETNWFIVKDWNEKSRYRNFTQKEASEIIRSITTRQAGVLRWIKQYW